MITPELYVVSLWVMKYPFSMSVIINGISRSIYIGEGKDVHN